MDQQKRTDEVTAPRYAVAIKYKDGRPRVWLTPTGGLPADEATAIARTYEDTAHAEGGHINVIPACVAEAA